MKTIPAGLATRLAQRVTSLVVCWRVTRQDGELLLGTQSDVDVVVSSGSLAGTYVAKTGVAGSGVESTSDLSVDNLEVDGALDDALVLTGLSAADLEAGLLDQAEVVLFLVAAEAPDDGQLVLRRGSIGNVTWTSEASYRAELRGLFQYFSQIPIRTYGQACDAELGDARCGVNLAPLEVVGTVTAIASRRRFDAISGSSPVPTEGDFVGGLLEFTTGANAGYRREVKDDAVLGTWGQIEVAEAFPEEVVPGDTFVVRPGCDKSLATCRDRFANLLNFRGHGVYVPGQNEILKVGGQ